MFPESDTSMKSRRHVYRGPLGLCRRKSDGMRDVAGGMCEAKTLVLTAPPLAELSVRFLLEQLFSSVDIFSPFSRARGETGGGVVENCGNYSFAVQ